MTARLIDGKAFAATVRGRLAERVKTFVAKRGFAPGLAVVLVGDDPASQVYVRNKVAQCAEVGVRSLEHRLPATTSEGELLALVAALNADPAVHGILVQLPLPKGIDETKVLAAIAPEKDADGFHVVNAGLLATGGACTVPCTPLGCMMLIEDVLGDVSGAEAVVVGRSNIVGKPMAQLLLRANCTVTIAHSRTRDLPGVCRRADILVAAVGRPEMIRGDWVKPGACVIDVGINRVPRNDGSGKTRLVGDVAFDEAKVVAGAITPVPGGVGPMTIACLLTNTLSLAERS
ncbi:Methylenetetrahydrofolate dehydrogenase [Rhodovulum sp. PH10]|uniref:bifunctional methylenetetrahydrofolate dehydrogenase/methenyltetrahydrofolate cyclohydrolase FolD n=1 Tax=Rhodovulum sp. PH10 TaxID=1187851 RepID=UPI00027C2E2F|nr:bifunctional methylenetetrahydrofolate dehydrogenase/methenyltetrahydrofolate cyclohydrolase FolD [Rhodovulum sp. PH10]EJW10554.1 Methylenetetrahydrofolate dehydrogenase [Rhodovulum sp. PH10]